VKMRSRVEVTNEWNDVVEGFRAGLRMEERFRLVATSSDLEGHAGIYNAHQFILKNAKTLQNGLNPVDKGLCVTSLEAKWWIVSPTGLSRFLHLLQPFPPLHYCMELGCD
jgi:hypothetical protein